MTKKISYNVTLHSCITHLHYNLFYSYTLDETTVTHKLHGTVKSYNTVTLYSYSTQLHYKLHQTTTVLQVTSNS